MLSVFKSVSLASFFFITTLSSSYLLATNLRLEDREPEAATGLTQKRSVSGQEFMIAAANPYASEAGFNILKKGGSAVDAAIAVQLVLTLVEPQSSGIGGGAFFLHWHKSKQHLTTFDGRETAPKAATAEMFLDKQGKAMPWIKAVVGGQSVGVPGVLKALKKAHDKFGKLPWQDLFIDAIKLANHGFIVSPRLEKLLTMEFNPGVSQLSESKSYFFPEGTVIKAGSLLKNKKLAKVYQSLAKEGIDAFYHGWIAKKIVAAVQQSDIAPGKLTLDDLANYQAKQSPAICGRYHQFNVCGMGPPSSGGVAVIQTLGQLESFELSQFMPNDPQAVHLFTQSSRLAFADRNKYIADDDFVNVPIKGLLDKRYLASRAQLISKNRDMGKAVAGQPSGSLIQADDLAYEMPSTSHIAIVDGDGNAISMTTSIEMAFGSAVMVEGFLLNNQLTDFSLRPDSNGVPIANRIEALKRPRSSMAPTMVFNQDNSLKLVVGSPGGSRIINYVTQTIIGVIDWQLDPQTAINLPKVTNRNKVTTLEKETSITDLKPLLEAMGHKISIRNLNSGLHAIEVTKDGLLGGADPRREGSVLAH